MLVWSPNLMACSTPPKQVYLVFTTIAKHEFPDPPTNNESFKHRIQKGNVP